MKRASAIACLLLLVTVHAAAQEPRTGEQFNNRGLQRQNQGDIDGAIADFTAGLSRGGQQALLAALYYNRANARMAKNDFEGAIADYSKAIGIQSGDPDMYFNRGVAYLTLADYDHAIADFSKAIEIQPGSSIAYNNRA